MGIQDPLDTRGYYFGIAQGKEQSVVTSGVYERFFIEDGQRYHHIFSVVDGYPVHNNLLSVTIISDRSIDGDALSTAAFVLGYEKGRALIDSIDGVEGIFVFDDQSIRLTDGIDFTLVDDNYWIVSD